MSKWQKSTWETRNQVSVYMTKVKQSVAEEQLSYTMQSLLLEADMNINAFEGPYQEICGFSLGRELQPGSE